MIRFLIHILINLVTAAIGLLLAGWIVPGVELQPTGFIVAVVVFALAQGVLGPFVFNVARQYASAILGGIGLVTTLIALAIASLFDGGLSISGFMAWVGATLLVWIVTALGGWILGWLFITRRLGEKSEAAQ
ncbi:phage holin family protein [Arthrobacter sp. SX1312]|uniref:phage holin family protein n=1 Tax=Arthrobacter sp. SX1312 TaxID=2058896 RepID=UPI000CE30EE3|nr:phage holin family protein [Arthrobacter sp. SX1312]